MVFEWFGGFHRFPKIKKMHQKVTAKREQLFNAILDV